jgi:peptide deformylase
MSTKLEIKTYPEGVLAQKTQPITSVDKEVHSLAENMAETMYEGQGIGLAAPQVGQTCQLITVDVSGPSLRQELITLINPYIISKEGEVSSEEGCLSVPGFQGKITRAAEVVVKALNLDGKEFTLEADGLLAICLQHEIDHLQGKLILDHVSRLKRNLYEKKIKKCQNPKK